MKTYIHKKYLSLIQLGTVGWINRNPQKQVKCYIIKSVYILGHFRQGGSALQQHCLYVGCPPLPSRGANGLLFLERDKKQMSPLCSKFLMSLEMIFLSILNSTLCS